MFDPASGLFSLSPEQASASAALVDKVKADAFSATLLDGVPGAGKTEAAVTLKSHTHRRYNSSEKRLTSWCKQSRKR